MRCLNDTAHGSTANDLHGMLQIRLPCDSVSYTLSCGTKSAYTIIGHKGDEAVGKGHTDKQRELLIKSRGHPILSLEFDVFPGNKVSMWAHTRHDVPFLEMKQAFEAIRAHIDEFIQDGDMCPFNTVLQHE